MSIPWDCGLVGIVRRCYSSAYIYILHIWWRYGIRPWHAVMIRSSIVTIKFVIILAPCGDEPVHTGAIDIVGDGGG